MAWRMNLNGSETIRLYHGSPERDFTPTFGLGWDQHDYGRGFYLTEFPDPENDLSRTFKDIV